MFYLLVKKRKAVIIDIGFNGKNVLNFCLEKGIEIKKIFLTHGHFDHIKDLQMLSKYDSIEVYVHTYDYQLLFNENNNILIKIIKIK